MLKNKIRKKLLIKMKAQIMSKMKNKKKKIYNNTKMKI